MGIFLTTCKFPFCGHTLKNWPLLYSSYDSVTKQILHSFFVSLLQKSEPISDVQTTTYRSTADIVGHDFNPIRPRIAYYIDN